MDRPASAAPSAPPASPPPSPPTAVPRAWRLLHRALDRLLRETYGHELSVQLLAAASVALLASAALYFAAPLLEDDWHLYARFLPWTRLLDWSHYDSFVVDHAVVFATLALPAGWLLVFHVAHSSISSRVEVALLALRVASCLTVSAALTVLLAEFFSRRAMLAVLALAYGSLGLLYSWSAPLWRWYMSEARARGLVAFLPEALQAVLLRTSLLDWLADSSLSDKLRPFLPFLLPLSRAEQMALLEQMPVDAQRAMTRPGFLLPMLPDAVQKALLPADECEDEDEDEEDDAKPLLLHDTDAESTTASSTSSTSEDAPTETALTAGGFDFHRPEVRESVLAPRKSHEQIMSEIVTTRIWSGCKDLVKTPSPSTLQRTASVSSALLVMQLYASKGSRRAFVALLQLAVVSALGSVACGAIFLRLLQLMDRRLSLRSVPLVHYARRLLLRGRGGSQGQLADSAADSAVDATPESRAALLRKAATSASVVATAIYVVKRLRQ